MHVDLDQFLAAVEVLRHPELRGKPVVVGGDGDPTKRGVVSTASYEARVHGVRSGIPLRVAARRLPDAVFLPVDKDAYDSASADVMRTLKEFGVVEILGWDEAFVGVDHDQPEVTARRIQERVLAETRLECSVGIGQNKLQAKLATGFGKPAGIFRITHDTWFAVLGDRPTDALYGIGSKTAKRLAALGIETVRQLAHADPDRLGAALGPATGPWLVQIGRGRASARVSDTPHVVRSRSREMTFQQDLEDWDEVRAAVVELAHKVAADVSPDGRDVARMVVKVRYAPFFTSSHGRKTQRPTTDPHAMELSALAALEAFTDRRPVRLVGVRAEFVPDDQGSAGP
nr:DNA polymerase IV [Phytoactinopolyspora alkaliphila]